MGNLTLLGSPFLFHVRLTLKKSVAEHEEAIREIVEKAKHGWVPVSGFADTPAVPARDIRKYLAASHQFRANCLAMNDLAAALCSVGTCA